ncbi:MAG: penicillin-binding transpeptidase domain-containing protein [Chloroflexota bacterium]
MKQTIQLVWSVFLLGLLVGCDAIPQLPQSSDSADAPVSVQRGNTPQETVENFLSAWTDEQFETMYGLLHPRSLEVYPLEDFVDLYETTHADISFNGVSYEIGDITTQGTSTAITYDVLIDSISFGEIADNNRTMRLVETDGRWTIAWSPMDIINGMTANVRLDPTRQSPPRGDIYDTNGLPLVLENGTTYGLIMRLSDMNTEEDCTLLLSRLLLRPQAYFINIYNDYRSADSAFFVGEIDGETYQRNRADLDAICGTDIEVEFIGSKVQARNGRTYFGHGAAAHVTGYISFVQESGVYDADYWRARGYSDRDFVGLAGIEFAYQDALAGVAEQSLRLVDSSGVTLRELGTSSGSPSTSVSLTIDRELQWNTAQAFIDAWNFASPNWVTQASGGGAVVMDVNSGAILSMFSFPTFDPSIFYTETTYWSTNTTRANASSQISYATQANQFLPVEAATVNHALTQNYFPGSVFKIMSALAAGDSGTWGQDQLFNCELTWDGSQRFGDTGGIREDWRVVSDQDAAGEITMATALTTSCNPFFWEVGAIMYETSPDLLSSYVRGWGFGRPTNVYGLEAEIEAAGAIPEPTDVTFAINNVIGQGDTTVTAIQMARLVSAVANGGTLYRPYLVEQVGGNGSPVLEIIEPVVEGQLGVTDVALAIVQEGMCDVPIDPDFGTSIRAFAQAEVPPTYTSCGKTGTAQTAGAPNAWYVAYAPADNPQIAVAVIVPNSRNGSEVSAPITRRILDYYFNAPIAPYPEWWEDDYTPVELPQGVGG